MSRVQKFVLFIMPVCTLVVPDTYLLSVADPGGARGPWTLGGHEPRNLKKIVVKRWPSNAVDYIYVMFLGPPHEISGSATAFMRPVFFFFDFYKYFIA